MLLGRKGRKVRFDVGRPAGMKARVNGVRTGLLVVAVVALCSGCQLPVPQTKIAFNPRTHTLGVKSPKNISIEKLEVLAEGTNVTLTVVGYRASNAWGQVQSQLFSVDVVVPQSPSAPGAKVRVKRDAVIISQ